MERMNATPATTETTHAHVVDTIQAQLAKLPQLDLPLTHRFTPGLYIREIFMPKGSLVVSKIHKTEHPFVVSHGHAAVWTEETGVVQIKAPYIGITKPGTRRILFIHEDCIWTTFHPTTETDVAKIEAQIIEPRTVTEALGDQERFAKCLERARMLVRAYRGGAPAGCDPQNTWAMTAIAAVGVGLSAYEYASQPGPPKPPDASAASRAGVEADAATLADRRRLEAAAQQGASTTYQTADRKEKQPFAMVPAGPPNAGAGYKLVPYVPADWAPGGQYAQYGAPTIVKKNVTVPGQTKTADFTGYGEADVQGAVARANAQNTLDLEKKYGGQFIDEALKQQQLADPEGTAAREKLYELIQQQAGDQPDRPVATLLDDQVRQQLAAGKGLDKISADVLNQAVAQAQGARGENGGSADQFAEPLTTGFAGQQRLDAAQQKALGWLSSGATPEDTQYRRDQQTLANEAAFVNGQTPESQFQNLSGAQNGPAPVYRGNPLPTPNGNAGGAMQTAQLQGWQTKMGAAANQADPWITGISALLNGASAAGNAGWKPLA